MAGGGIWLRAALLRGLRAGLPLDGAGGQARARLVDPDGPPSGGGVWAVRAAGRFLVRPACTERDPPQPSRGPPTGAGVGSDRVSAAGAGGMRVRSGAAPGIGQGLTGADAAVGVRSPSGIRARMVGDEAFDREALPTL